MPRLNMGHPDYVYQPWSEERRAAHSIRSRVRLALDAARRIVELPSTSRKKIKKEAALIVSLLEGKR